MVNVNPPLSISSPTPVHSTRTTGKAGLRILNYMGHAIHMLDNLKQQNQSLITADKLGQIYQRAEDRIHEINAQLYDSVSQPSPSRVKERQQIQEKLEKAKQEVWQNNNKVALLNYALKEARTKGRSAKQIKSVSKQLEKAIERTLESQERFGKLTKQLENVQLNLSKKEVKNLKESLASAEEEIVELIRQTQIEVAAEIGERYVKGTKSQVATLAEGGWGATWIRFLALVSKSHHNALIAFKISQGLMEAMSRQDLPSSESEIDLHRQDEFQSYQTERGSLDRRAGVIGLKGIYRFQTFFSKKAVHRQFQSFIAQNLSQLERTTLEHNIQIEEKSFQSQLIPLNKEFDKQMGLRGSLTAVFTSIFGTKGISSTNRQEAHLINGWESNLIYQDKTIFRSLRHAITSDKYEKNPAIRKTNSEKAAAELIKAAILQELASQGLTLEEAKAKGIHLHFNSVSLVTPDDLRPFIPSQANERQMLLDQVLALKSFQNQGQTLFELDGVQIPVNVHVNTFNFGVNALASTFKMGLANQYAYNLEAMQGLRQQFTSFNEKLRKEFNDLKRSQDALNLQNPADQQLHSDIEKKIQHLSIVIHNSTLLMLDIEQLMANKKAYLAGDNQYEIGAKVLNLSNVMDRAIEFINQDKSPMERTTGVKCAFNCMSGKDRTGMMDSIAKAFAILSETRDGRYPSHQELQTDLMLRKQFAEILEKVLLESGNLEITGINTGAKGYKVQGEARLLGMSIEVFLQMQGLSSTTSS